MTKRLKKKLKEEETKRLKFKAIDELVTIRDTNGPPRANKSCMKNCRRRCWQGLYLANRIIDTLI